jgi:hypothetical protein
MAGGGGAEEDAAEPEPITAPAAKPAPAGRQPKPAARTFPTPEGLTETQSSVFAATANTIYHWRTVRGIAMQVELPQGTVQSDLDKLVELGHVKKREPKGRGAVVYGAAARVAA